MIFAVHFQCKVVFLKELLTCGTVWMKILLQLRP